MEQLIKIQAGLKAPKDNYNKFGKYPYRSAEDILSAVKPLAEKNDCYVKLEDELVQIGERYYIKATASIHHEGESVQSTAFAREPEIKKGMDPSQITGAASSYARKYALNGLFAIDNTGDADDNDQTEAHIPEEIRMFGVEEQLMKYANNTLTKQQREKYKDILNNQIKKIRDATANQK